MMKCFFLTLTLFLSLCFSTNIFCAPAEGSPWEGDITMFETDASGQIRFVSPTNQAGEARLRQKAQLSSSMTWELDVRLDFGPTNFNNLRIYVHADGADTFYIQAGNNEARISLYEKKANGSSRLHIIGRKAFTADQNGFVTIRLTLDADRTFTLYTRHPAETEFHCEGSADYRPSQATREAMLDLRFRYVRARTCTFTLRNISISHNGTPETIPLQILETETTSSSEIIFRFNREVDIANARCLETESGEAMIIGYADDKQSVAVRLADPMKQGRTYSFAWLNLIDASGQPADELTCTLTFAPTTPADPLQIIISEVMANPVGLTSLPPTEYVELQNASATPVSLQGWTLLYDGKPSPIDIPCLLSPGAYAVLFREGRKIYVDPNAASLGLAKFPSALANSGKTLAVLDPAGNETDRFSYPPALDAVSWEYSPDGCHHSSDPRGGTPGAPNSTPSHPPAATINPGDIIFNELLPEPHESGSEYIELYNRSPHSIPLSQLIIATRKTDGSLVTYSLASLTAEITSDSYALLTPDRSGVTAFYHAPNPDAIHQHPIPRLADISSSLLLIDRNNDRIIDEITYNSQWHSPLIKNKKGVALERIDPNAPTQASSNWTSASSATGHGTPGYLNSQHHQPTPTETPEISPPTWTNNSCEITYRLDAPGYACRIHIYNMQGRTVAQISPALTGTTGAIPLNANQPGGPTLRPGLYIFHAELYSPTGKTLQYKKPLLVK